MQAIDQTVKNSLGHGAVHIWSLLSQDDQVVNLILLEISNSLSFSI